MKAWYVLYVKSRAEKKVAERLKERGRELFCPLKTEVRQWSDRKKKVVIPYFPSYIFIRINYSKERLSVLQETGVVGFLHWMKKPATIREEEMEEVIAFFKDNKNNRIVKEPIVVGERYKIERGPFMGKMGKVEWKNGQRAVLEIPGLNLKFSVDKVNLTSLK